MKKKAHKDFLTIPEAAKYLDVGERTLFRYLHDGRITAAKLGRWRFRKGDLDAFIEQSFKTYTPPPAPRLRRAGKE